MSSPFARAVGEFRGVIVGVDGSDESRRALAWAAGEARLRQRPLEVVHAVDLPHSQLLASSDQAGDLPGRIVDEAVADVRDRWPDLEVSGRWRVGTPWTVLVREAEHAELLVVGSRGHGRLGSVLVGSVSTEVAQFARCPVLVVRESRSADGPTDRHGVVVGVDGSSASLRAVEFAFDEASRRRLPLTAVHAVWDPMVESQAVASVLSRPERAVPGDAEMLDVAETLAGWRERYPDVAVDVRYESGRPQRVLADVSDGAALLVVGSRGRGPATALLLGSVSRDVLKYARCPVAIIRQHNSERGSAGRTAAQTAGG